MEVGSTITSAQGRVLLDRAGGPQAHDQGEQGHEDIGADADDVRLPLGSHRRPV